ncbi:MAG: DUF6261 family protein [Tannerellaceae bacterium]|jgi:hypothetical protein|nr:DUF6261 family protein [Tannerellaceae bacterium]
MSIKIKAYSTLLGSRLSVSQALQFHKNLFNYAAADLASIPELVDLVNEWEQRLNEFDATFRNGGYKYETFIVTGKDTGRDFTTRALVSRITTMYNYPLSEEQRLEAVRLYSIVDTYKKADRREYEAETSFVRNLISDLRKHTDLLIKYGFVEVVDRLEVENDEFDVAFNTRTAARQEVRDQGNLKDHRKNTNEKFDRVCKVVTGLMLMPTTPEVKTKLTKSIGVINSNVEQFNGIYGRHAGIVAKQKKKEEDKDDNGDKKPEPTPPSPPDQPNQNPDNTLPPAPDTPNQTPDATPPPINPEDLNPPAAGERKR